MPVNNHIFNSQRFTAYDSEFGLLENAQATAFPCSGNSSRTNTFSRQELQPYRNLETQYAQLFASDSIVELDDTGGINLNGFPFAAQKIMDVDLDECVAINLSRDGFDAIGTTGLASCIGMAARGTNNRGETILSLYHYSGSMSDTPVQALERTKLAAQNKGASNISMFLIGGMISRDPYLNTLQTERDLLSMHRAYGIRGVRLHASRSVGMSDNEYVSMVVTKNQVYYSKGDLYVPD